jgi:hypothetical protein
MPPLDYVADGVTEEIILKLNGFNPFVIEVAATIAVPYGPMSLSARN